MPCHPFPVRESCATPSRFQSLHNLTNSQAHRDAWSERDGPPEGIHRQRVELISKWLGRSGVPPEDLPDQVQEVFVRILEKLPRFRDAAAPATWVFAICRNVAIDRHRRESARRRFGTIALADEISYLDSYEVRELRHYVRIAISHMSPRHRAFLEFDLGEVTDMVSTGWSGFRPSALRSIRHRAKAEFLGEAKRLPKGRLRSFGGPLEP